MATECPPRDASQPSETSGEQERITGLGNGLNFDLTACFERDAWDWKKDKAELSADDAIKAHLVPRLDGDRPYGNPRGEEPPNSAEYPASLISRPNSVFL